jgi:pimeloyl-ACP methyl ester carboxylesterase
MIGAAEARFVFFPYKGEDENPSSLGIPYSVVNVQTADGERLTAWQLEPGRPVADVVYFHGNGGNLSVWLPVLASMHHVHLRVLAVDYRGYGTSTGTPTEEGIYRDAEAVVRHVQNERPAGVSRPTVYWGRSLGGAVAASAARLIAPDGLILESTFADKAAVVRSHPMLRVLNVFATYRFPTAEMLKGVRRPVLVLHGDRDRIIPYRLGEELYNRLGSPKQFIRIPGADHNDFFGPARGDYWTPILQFIASLPVHEADKTSGTPERSAP